MLPAVTPIVEGATSVTVAVQPVPVTFAVAPVDKRKPDGSVSTKEIPDCTGLPVELVSRNLTGETPPTRIDAAPKVLVNVGGGVATEVTNRHWLDTALLTFVNPLIDDCPLVNAAGLVVQSAFELAAGVFVIPLTTISQLAVPAPIAPAETLIVEGAVNVTVAEQPVPVTVAAAPAVKRKPEGNVSTKVIPLCTGLPVEFVSRKFRGVLAPAGIEAAPKVLVNVGSGGVTTRHWLDTPLLAFANPLIDDEPFVNAAGLAVQSRLAAAVLVIPLTAISQLTVPTLIVPADTLIDEGAVNVTVAEQPVPVTVAVAPVVKRKPEGSVSTNAIPACAGLPVAFVSRKLSGVLAPARIEAAPNALVNIGVGSVVTSRHWLVTALLAFTSPLIEVGPFVNAGGFAAQSALAAEVLVTPLTATSQIAAPVLIVAPDTVIVDGAVSVTVPVQPVPTNEAVALVVRRKPEGRLSTKAIPDCAGLPAEFVSRKFTGVLAPAKIEAAPKALVNVGGGGGVTTRHWLVTPLLAFVNPVIEVWPLVNAVGLVEQSTLAAAVLVTPLTTISQLAVPVFIMPAATLIVEGAVNVTVAEQPAPVTVEVAPVVKRRPEGSVSTKAIPVCTGLPVEFVRRKTSGVVAPLGIVAAAKLLVSDAKVTEPTATVTALVVELCAAAPSCCELLAVLVMVEPGGTTAAPTIDAEPSISQKMARLVSQKPVRLNVFCSTGG